MCVEPGRLANGTEFACRKCWQCLENHVDNWVGRCLAESKTAVAAHSITLTYGRDEHGNEDHMRSAWLTYSDVQKFFKLLRRDGYKFRYLVAGEYGSTKGRAHWHLLMFWTNKVPPHELSELTPKRFHNKYWPHGYQHWEEPRVEGIRYVCKYIQKDMGEDQRQFVLRMSKKPPLGNAYFRQLAVRYVENGLAPQNLKYRFADVKGRDGKQRQFFMHGTTARNFLDYYLKEWERVRRGPYPQSTLIEEHLDWQFRQTEAYEEKKARLAKAGLPVPPTPPEQDVEQSDGEWTRLRGSPPETARSPDGQLLNYSDLAGSRYWYRKIEGEGFQWVKETIVEQVRRKLKEKGWSDPNPDQ